MKSLLLAVGLLITSPVLAESQEWLQFGGVSYHITDTNKYNGFNYGVGYERQLNDKWNLMVGNYRNSIYNNSRYVFGSYVPSTTSFFSGHIFGGELRYMGGFVTGYKVKVMPIALPTLCWKYGCLLGLPPLGKTITTPVVAFNFRIPLKH